MRVRKKSNKSIMERKGMLDIVLLVVLGLLALTTIFPFYQVILISFADSVTYAKYPLYVLPYAFDLTGYKTVMKDKAFLDAFGVSVIVTLSGTAISMFLSVCGAYVLSKHTLIGRKLFLNMILFTMLFGGGLIPSYLVGRSLGLVNSIWCMIIPGAIGTYNMIIMKNFFISLPESLLDAAKIDGAGEFKILIRVALPISAPLLATFSLFYAHARWNEWYSANIYISKRALQPLQIYLRNILINMDKTLVEAARQHAVGDVPINHTQIQMATIVVSTVPILMVYPFIQKHFVKGILIGSVKA